MNRLGPLLPLLGVPILGGAARQTAIPVEFIGDWSSSIERCALGPADYANIRIGPRVIQEFGTRLDVRYVVKQDTSGLFEHVRTMRPDIILLDVDMPGLDTFVLLSQLAQHHPQVRVLMFSGHVRQDYIDRAVEMGAWGYVSKNEGIVGVLDALDRAAAGEFVLSPDALAIQRSGQ